MTQVQLALVYSILVFGASLLGGYIPRWIKLTHDRMQTAISFVAGVILGIGVLHLIPHAIHETGAPDKVMLILLCGFLTMFFLQRIFHFHTHEVWDGSDDAEPNATAISNSSAIAGNLAPPSPALVTLPMVQTNDHVHGPDCGHGHHHGHEGHDHMLPTGQWSWAGVFLGLALHSLIDGLALGAAIQAESKEGEGALLAGLGYFLAVFLHKPFDSISITSLMHMTGWSRKSCNTANWIYALIAPLGVWILFLTAGRVDSATSWMGGMLAFAAGACICIATSDLLPELHFHSHDRVRLSVALLLGLGMAWGLVYLEHKGHDHHQHPQPINRIMKEAK